MKRTWGSSGSGFCNDSDCIVSEVSRNPVTLTKVAEAVGVSPSTVSNAYNRPDQLSAALRQRILAAARELGYAGPDPRASTLRRGPTGSVGLMFDDPLTAAFTDPAALGLLRGVAEACQDRGVALLLVPDLGGEGADHRVVRSALVDGFILYCDRRDDERRQVVRDRNLPFVSVDSFPDGPAPWVGIDDRAAARRQAEHLLNLGHRRFGVATLAFRYGPETGPVPPGEQGSVVYWVTEQRLLGYRDALAGAGIDWDTVPVHTGGWPDWRRAGATSGAWLLDRPDRPTAVLAMGDLLALGILDAARARGIVVPRDLSVIGFDDTDLGASADPPLTTVRQPFAEKGRLAVRLLIDGAEPGTVIELPTELVVRASTGPVPAT